jgi:preprotein translocase subunit SecE
MADNNKGSEKTTAQTPVKKEKRGGLIAYLGGVKQEFSKVVWPTREELTTDTIVVFACVAFFAVAFWLVDTGFLAALKGILGITLS